MLQRKRNLRSLIGIILLTIIAGYIVWPSAPDIKIKSYYKELKIHKGLDLAGGTHLVYEAQTEGLSDADKAQAMTSLKNVIDRRINSLGVSEPTIQTGKIGDKDTLIIELPGVSDVEAAKNLIGQTAQLRFIAQLAADPDGNPFPTDESTLVSGKDLKKASVVFDEQSGMPQVQLQFNDEGREKFAAATRANIGQPIYILLDRQIISAPTVQSEITAGEAVITGQFTIPEAKQLSTLINGGALPVSINVVEQRNVGATLGDESIKNSLVAGLLGLALIAIFMIAQYRFPGFLAVLALGVYTLITLALFKLVPITLTLAGIAGFILSIGMAVDANILIFERMKEELRAGQSQMKALEIGFNRAWSSIKDSNISSLITAAILIWFGSGIIRGFAVTLALGILVSMFTAITVSRTFLRLSVQNKK
jgi:preprotein translocase subunit SecD